MAQETRSGLKQIIINEYNNKYNIQSDPLVKKSKAKQPTITIKILSRELSPKPLSHPLDNIEVKTPPLVPIEKQKKIESSSKPNVAYKWWIKEVNLTFYIYPVIHSRRHKKTFLVCVYFKIFY